MVIKIESYKDKIKAWIVDGFNEEFIAFAYAFGKQLASKSSGLTTTQIRNFYGELLKQKAKATKFSDIKQQFILLKPRLAYAAKKEKEDKPGLNELKDALDLAIDAVLSSEEKKQDSAFSNFADFFEAIIAYHRAEGGK